jgi:predicted acetyltransferase
MIIKHPENKDIPGLRRLWQQAFGDTDSLLDKFFRVGFGFDRCLCIRDGAQIVAALYWFDCSWGKKKVAYIYAVATDEGYRGQGLCRRLMDDAHRQLREQGYCGAALVPGEEDLIRLY